MRVGRPIIGEAKVILDAFVKTIAEKHGVTVKQIMVARSDRHPAAARARFHAYAVVKWSSGLSYPEIGAYFGVDHTTVIYGTDKWEGILNGDEDSPGRAKPRRPTVIDVVPEEGASVVRIKGSG